MKLRFLLLIFGSVLTFLSSSGLSAQGFAVTIDSAQVQSGQVVCLPVRALGFTNIVSFQHSLSWDKKILTYDHTQDYNLPGWISTDFYPIAPGKLLVGWSSPSGLPSTRANGTSLYQACFKVIGPLGSSSLISPGTDGFPPGNGGAEAYTSNDINVWTPGLNAPGLVEVTLAAGVSDAGNGNDASFQLSPNPTSASAQVLLKSRVSGSAKLLVTDASGRTVLEEKIPVTAGENRFEIPAKVLNVKGMYQGSLQTELGVSSQMLSVQ